MCTSTGFRTCCLRLPPVAYGLRLIVYIWFMEGMSWIHSLHRSFFQMVHRKFQADSQRAHGSIEGLHKMRTTLMDVTVGTFQA